MVSIEVSRGNNFKIEQLIIDCSGQDSLKTDKIRKKNSLERTKRVNPANSRSQIWYLREDHYYFIRHIYIARSSETMRYSVVQSNAKHWFTPSFLQPLPYLVTPQGPENCQLTSSFLLMFKQ